MAYKLLKMETKLFNKKLRQKPENMKIISDIFCQEKYMDKIRDNQGKEAAMREMADNFTQDVIQQNFHNISGYQEAHSRIQ